MRWLAGAILAVASLASPIAGALAQDYPNRPLRVVVPYTPGGGTDSVARALATRLSARWGQPIVVDNRPGAGTTLGADIVAKAPADGYTLLFSDTATFVINPHLYDRLPYDPRRAFAPVALVTRLAPVLAVNPAVPARTLPELLAHARAHPGALTYASPGNGTYTHVAMAYLTQLAGVSITHVPYRGTAGVMPDLLADRVSMYLITSSVVEPQAREGKLRLLAAATERRLPLMPDLPAVNETVPGFAINVWFGLAAPAGTPEPVLDRLHAAVAEVLASPEFSQQVLAPQSFSAGDLSREEFARLLDSDFERWGTYVQRSGARIE
jgi:tripartite-type tricarboxylate transporter receptor subunit TctC